jgi:hypothetical protein
VTPDDLARILDDLGERLGPAGEHAFALAVQHAAISAWLGVIAGSLLLILGVAVVVLAIWISDGDADDAVVFVGFLGLLSTALGLAIAFVALPNALVPEYAALRNLLGAIAP